MRLIRTQATHDAEVTLQQKVGPDEWLAAGAPKPKPADDYFDRVAAYIPGEIVALYLPLAKAFDTFYDLPPGAANKAPYWVCQLIFIACLVFTPLYLWLKVKARDPIQIGISTTAFFLWAMSLALGWFHAVPMWFGALLLPLFTFAVGFYEPKKTT